jgi:hypothetical protein
MKLEGTTHLYLASLLLVGILGASGVARAIEVGDKAPDFTLPSTTGGKISLNQFRGRKYVLLEFYIRDFAAT